MRARPRRRLIIGGGRFARKMFAGPALAVVDDELRVHGLEGLRGHRRLLMPAVTSTNSNAPTIMIAEKGAATIKGRARQRLVNRRR